MEKNHKYLIIGLSIAVPAIVAFLIYKPMALGAGGNWVGFIPHVNAAINSTTSILLLIGLYFIKHKQISYHRLTMLSAFFLGCIFLIGYIIYHSTVAATSYDGQGTIRLVYYTLLISHIILAAVVVPLVLLALYYALKGKIPQHKRIVKLAYPIWLYVSVTGVLVYYLIRPFYG